MKTKSEHIHPYRASGRASERGNALIYVLIAIALFGALSFTLGRQTDTSEAGSLSDELAELYATQMISYSSQVKSSIDQMLFTSASDVSDLDFTAPTAAGFDTGTLIHKVYHPQGGGITPGKLPPQAIAQTRTDPVAGWYLGRFDNVDWTPLDSTNTAGTAGATLPWEDVILVAYQINQKVCELINQKVNGSSTIPASTAQLRNILIDDALGPHTGTNVEFTTGTAEICPDCNNVSSLCIQEGGIYAYYTVIADQ